APLADPLQEIEVLAAEESELHQHLDPEDEPEAVMPQATDVDLADDGLDLQAPLEPAPAAEVPGAESELVASDDNWSVGEPENEPAAESLDLSLDAPLEPTEAPVAPAVESELLVSDDNWNLGELDTEPATESLDLSLDAPLEP